MSDEAGPTFGELRNGYVTIRKAEYERLIAAAKERDELLAAASQILTRHEQLEGACDCFQQSSEVANAEAEEAQRENSALRAEVVRLREALTAIRDCCADRERVVMIGVRLFAGIEHLAIRALEKS